jgi:hypothetical protein
MGESQVSIYFSQLKAMLKRNILLKKREKRKTTAVSSIRFQEISLTCYVMDSTD